MHGTEVGNVLHFDYLSPEKRGAIGVAGLVEGSYEHLLVFMEDVGRFVWLEEAAFCSSEVAARAVLKWCALFGVPRAFVSDGGTHFAGETMKMVSARFGVTHHFGVANVSWTSGTIERMDREVVRTFGAILSK